MIIAFNEPFALIPMVSIKYMTQNAMDRGFRAINDLYFYGWVYGYVVTKQLVKIFKLKKFEERYKIAMDIASLVGFGDYQTLNFVRGKFSRFRVIKNPLALQFYPTDKMVDHYLRGMNAGGGTLVHEKLIDCIELDCAAKNKEHCLFVNASREILSQMKRIAKTQLDIKYLVQKQRSLIESCGDDPSFFGI